MEDKIGHLKVQIFKIKNRKRLPRRFALIILLKVLQPRKPMSVWSKPCAGVTVRKYTLIKTMFKSNNNEYWILLSRLHS